MNKNISEERFQQLKKSAIGSLEDPGEAKKHLPKTDSDQKPILYLFRHTETHDNKNRIFSGRRDVELTPDGKKQAKKLAQKLKDKQIDVFMSSPLTRCRQTLKPLMELKPNVPYEPQKGLEERDYGDLTGKDKMKLMEEKQRQTILWRRAWDYPPPNGESLKMVWENRIKPFCQNLETRMRQEKINVAFAGTNNTMRLIRMYFEDLTKEQASIVENPFGDYASYHIS